MLYVTDPERSLKPSLKKWNESEAGLATADLYDEHGENLQVAEPLLKDYGRIRRFDGPIVTLKVQDVNTLVRTILEEKGEGRVLVVDGDGSLKSALVGEILAQIGCDQGWSGLVIYGGVRDAGQLARINIGIKALGCTPRRSTKGKHGRRDIPVTFAGVTFTPGHYLYADEDGIVLSIKKLN